MLLLLSGAQAQEQSRLTISVFGHDGRPLSHAHATLVARPWTTSAERTWNVDFGAEGIATLTLPPGLYSMQVSGLHHRVSETRHLLVEQAEEQLTVTLALPDYADPSDRPLSVHARSMDPDIPWDTLAALSRMAPLRFRAAFHSPLPQVLVALNGVDDNHPTAPPGLRDYRIDDRLGEWYGVVTAVKGIVSLDIDLHALPGLIPAATTTPVTERWSGAPLDRPAAHAADDVFFDPATCRRATLFDRSIATALAQLGTASADGDAQRAILVGIAARAAAGDTAMATRLAPAAEALIVALAPDSPWWNLVTDLRFLWHADTAHAADLLEHCIGRHPDEAVVLRAARELVGMLTARNGAGDSPRAVRVMTTAVSRITDPGMSIALKSGFPEVEWVDAAHDAAEGGAVQLIPVPRRRTLPEILLPAIDATGGLITNTSIAGHVTLMDFWATWCAPCIAELPTLNAINEQHQPGGLIVISISLDASSDLVTRFRRKRHPMPWRHAHLEEGFGSLVVSAMGVEGIPWMVLVDRQGRIAAEGPDLRGQGLKSAVHALMEEK